jgi:hypothetical protein
MDLSVLPDDQLLQLIEAVTKETTRRAIAIRVAASNYWQDTKEEIETHTTKPPPDRASAEGSTKATVIRLLKSLDFFRPYQYGQFSINIWEKNGDIRLYLQESFKTGGWKMTYYHTGNPWKLSGTVDAPDLQPHSIGGFKSFAALLCCEFMPSFKCYAKDDGTYPIDPTLLKYYQGKL